MKSIERLFAVGAVAIAIVAAPVANALPTYSATFTIVELDSDTFTFDISGANALTGDWTGAGYLLAFDFKGLGIDFSASGVSATAFYESTGPLLTGYNAQLNANICNDNVGETGSICFDPISNIAVAPDMLFTIDITGATLNFASTGPHLQILWGNDPADVCPDPRTKHSATGCDNNKIGSLYSQDIGSSSGSSSGSSGQVPEPSSNLLTLLGVGLLSATMWARRRSRRA